MFAKAGPVFLNPIPSTGTKGGVLCSSRKNNAFICFAALNARCAAEQTQTVTREAPTITVLPGKEKSPQLDDGDSGFPPRDDKEEEEEEESFKFCIILKSLLERNGKQKKGNFLEVELLMNSISYLLSTYIPEKAITQRKYII